MLGGDIFGVPVFGHWNHYHCGGGVFWLVVRAILESTPTLKRHEDYRWIGVGCTSPPLNGVSRVLLVYSGFCEDRGVSPTHELPPDFQG